jgi:hypothetical protein
LTSEVAALISKIAGEEYGSMRIAGQVMLAVNNAPSVARDFYVQADVEAKRYVVVEVSREDGEPRKLDGLHVGTKGQEYAQGLVDEINRIGGAAFLVELAF